MPSQASRVLWLVAMAAIFGLGFRRALMIPTPASFAVTSEAPAPLEPRPLYQVRFASSGVTPSVHSATATELDGGRLRAFWYGGTREGAADVAIYSAVFDPEPGEWSPETVVVTRDETRDELHRHVRKLGNPVVVRDGAGRLLLFYVSVSVGGWSGSAINCLVSKDEGESWGAASRLTTSPFANVSTLVRGPAFFYSDGTLGLPVYHELVGKFAELLRLDREIRILAKSRLSWGRSALQPVVVPLSEREAVALMRRSGRSPPRILMARTGDAGAHWTAPVPTSLPNPDAAIAALRLRDGRLLLAFNDSEVDRSSLRLATSSDGGRSWRLGPVLEPPESPESQPLRFAYPWLLETTDGELHLLYTWNRRAIVHVRFNRRWLEKRL